ncbi:MAG: rhamnogalacturonan lyase B N-terminal domain-containing protein, partial [Luteolibacter sp.]
MKPLLALLLFVQSAGAQFALKDDGKFFTVDCESVPKTIVQVNKSNGNLQSILVNGIQLQKNPRGSHINSG